MDKFWKVIIIAICIIGAIIIIASILFLALKYIEMSLIVAAIVIGMGFGALATVSVYSFFYTIEKK
jgi:hypothetical protein